MLLYLTVKISLAGMLRLDSSVEARPALHLATQELNFVIIVSDIMTKCTGKVCFQKSFAVQCTICFLLVNEPAIKKPSAVGMLPKSMSL